MHMNSMFVAI